MKTPEYRLMQFCWMRDLDYSHVTRFAPTFLITKIPTPEEYMEHCLSEIKTMEDYFTKANELCM